MQSQLQQLLGQQGAEQAGAMAGGDQQNQALQQIRQLQQLQQLQEEQMQVCLCPV